MNEKSKTQNESQYISYSWVLLVVLGSQIGTLTYSFQMNSMSDALKSLIILFRISEDWTPVIQAFLSTSAFFGAFLGSLLSLITVRFSYRKMIILLDCFLIFGSALQTVVNLPIFLLGRVIAGIGCGLHSIMIPLFLKMFCPKEIYPTMCALFQAIYAFAYVVTALVGLTLATPSDATYDDIDQQRLQIYFVAPSIFSLIRIVIFLTVITFEPPYYHVIHGKYEEANKMIKKIYKEKFRDEILQNYLKQKEVRDRKIELLSPNYKLRFMLAMFLCIQYQFNGQAAVLQYSTNIFLDMASERVALIMTLAMSISKYFFYQLGSAMQARLGRRTPYLVGNGMMGVCMTALTFFSYILEENYFPNFKTSLQILNAALIFCFMIANFNSIGFLLSIYVPELVPEKGVSIAFQGFWAGANFVLLMFAPIKAWVGISCCFLFFASNIWICQYILWKYALETMNKNETEIDVMFQRLRRRTRSKFQVQDDIDDPSVYLRDTLPEE